MRYLIGDVAKKLNLPTSTLRFYDKNGLLPFVDCDQAGRRSFKDNDLNFLEVIDCMKKCGMTIKEIRHFINLCMKGDITLQERYDLLNNEEKSVKNQIENLQDQLDFLHYKMWYFKTSLQAGTEEVHMVDTDEGERVNPDIHEQYQAALSKCQDIKELIEYQEQYQSEYK
ncbi:MerR family transcriptional regulator [Lactobacillus halodurans]|uniref:MerR family transcriptional regulator n=1 Tax=Companilactobacillus halodurans TaxID=2584183 RepID=A0A5P0ZP16_9LACO|nr:MerR family transcriptional regulator [Companilactobacillus halodurans]MQS75987.1 MerR family transcriptional regulator [Companilactobacillus halodurans]